MILTLRRCLAVFLRYFHLTKQLDQVADLFYWPAIDIFLWGMASVWLQGAPSQGPTTPFLILSGLILWQTVWRGNYELSVNLLVEFWNRNMVNLFATPLKFWEWCAGTMLFSLIKVVVSLLFGTLLVYALFGLNLFSMGWSFLAFASLLVVSGWWIGFLGGGLIVYWGQRIQMLAWMMPYVFVPFSAVFYPVAVLPEWGKAIAWCIPMTHFFEGMRHVLAGGDFPYEMFLDGTLLTALYFILSGMFFYFMFEKSRDKGLARLE